MFYNWRKILFYIWLITEWSAILACGNEKNCSTGNGLNKTKPSVAIRSGEKSEPGKLSESRIDNINKLSDDRTLQAEDVPHSRKKRLLWITDDGALALPPGMVMTLTPTLSMPFVRHPPKGFLSNLTISMPLTILFDELGLTDNQNPYGSFPNLFANVLGRAAGSAIDQYVGRYLSRRMKREAGLENEIPVEEEEEDLPEVHRKVFHGGERAILYGVAEDFLETFGMNGKGCLLRAICEVHSKSLHHLGIIGEMFKLFLTPINSPFSNHLSEYVRAQRIGEGKLAPAECYPYHKECPRSIFKAKQNKYKEYETTTNEVPMHESHEEDEIINLEAVYVPNSLDDDETGIRSERP